VPNKTQVKLEQKLLTAESANDTTNENSTISDIQLITTEEPSKADDLIKLQQKISQEILNSNLKEKEMSELQVGIRYSRKFQRISNGFYFEISQQERINKEILNSKLFTNPEENGNRKKLGGGRFKNSASVKARSLMNLHNNEAGRRVFKEKNLKIMH
jgi:hypothetical protein